MKGKGLWCECQLWWFWWEVCFSQYVCFIWAWMWLAELACSLGLLRLQWMAGSTAENPTFLWGKTTGMCWALRGVRSCLPKLSRVWALPMTTSSLLCKEEMGVKEPSPQACRLLWMSATGLSPGSLLLCLSLASSSASRGRTLAKATGAWQLVHVDADVLVEREINAGPFKAW